VCRTGVIHLIWCPWPETNADVRCVMRGARASYRDAVFDIRHPRRLSRRERRALRKAAEGLPTAQAQELVRT
jgi:hypothetical protein